MRRILTLPEAAEPGFLKIDAGFLRRTFYALATLAELPPSLCAPRALRYARGLEMLAANMEPNSAARALGFKNPLRLLALQEKTGEPRVRGKREENILAGIVTGVETSARAARVFLEITPRLNLYCVCDLEELLDVEPRTGHSAALYAPPAAILPEPLAPTLANKMECRVIATEADPFETRLRLKINSRLSLGAVLEPDVADRVSLKNGQRAVFHIPPRALKLRQTNS